MRRNILGAICLALAFGACSKSDDSPAGRVFDEKYTLTEADYAAISDNDINRKMAGQSGASAALERVKTELALNEDIPGTIYLPALLSEKYAAAADGSSVELAYDFRCKESELLSAYSSINMYKPTNKDYASVYADYADGQYAPYLSNDNASEATGLLSGYPDPKEGDVVFIDYRYSRRTTDIDALKGFLLWENFEDIATGKLASLKEWSNDKDWFIRSTGGADWKVGVYERNQYVEYSAKDTQGACEAWLVTPEITLETGDKLSFDVRVGYWNAACLSVWISTDFDGRDPNTASWKELTDHFQGIPKTPETGYGSSFISANSCDLSAYNGQTVRIAFKYVGDGANKKTTIYQIDNIMIGTGIPVGGGFQNEPAYALKIYDRGAWKEPDEHVLTPDYQDYLEMRLPGLCFSDDAPAVNYIPYYLMLQKILYPLNGDARVVAYRYCEDGSVKINSDEYVYNASAYRWELNPRMKEMTERFVRRDGTWIAERP